MKKIAIHGVPRSGTSWLGAIFDSSPNVAYRHQPLFSYAFKSFLSENSTQKEIDNFFYKILESQDNFILQKEGKEAGHIPTFNKSKLSHIVYKEARYHNILPNLIESSTDVKVVGIIRNPKSVLASWYNAPKEFNKQEWNLVSEWYYAKKKNQDKKEEFYGFSKWSEVATIFLKLKKKYPERFFLVNYSDLLHDTQGIVKKLFKFCELEYQDQTENFLTISKNKDLSEDAYSVFRKNQSDNKWIDILPESIISKVNKELSGTALEQFNKL